MHDQDLLRYSRHILLDAVGFEGQQALRHAHALVVGAGGLGSPAAIYLVASGIGTLTLVDADVVDLTNLQRQILHGEADVGTNKTASGAATLRRLNSDVVVRALCERIAGERLQVLVAEADVVLDCSDNFATRHAVNRACLLARKPLVSGAAIRFDGQITSFDFREAAASPCYACLFPESDEVDEATCSTMGIFAPLAGIIGTMQAAEAVKLVMGLGSLSGHLLILEALEMAWHSIRYFRDPQCPVCASETADAVGAGNQGRPQHDR